MAAFRDVLASCIGETLRNRRGNSIDWTQAKHLLGKELSLDEQRMNISLISHNNFHPRIRQRGFDAPLDLAVLISDVSSSFTDRVCDGLHRQRSRPDWPLLVLQETATGCYAGRKFVMGPTASPDLRRRVEACWPMIPVATYQSVWH